jgi:hypothetical protein
VRLSGVLNYWYWGDNKNCRRYMSCEIDSAALMVFKIHLIESVYIKKATFPFVGHYWTLLHACFVDALNCIHVI